MVRWLLTTTRTRARIAETGTGTGTAAWAGGRRLASGRARYGPASRVSRPRRWWRAGQMLDRRDTHGNGQHHADEPSNRHAGKDQDWPTTKPAQRPPALGRRAGTRRGMATRRRLRQRPAQSPVVAVELLPRRPADRAYGPRRALKSSRRSRRSRPACCATSAALPGRQAGSLATSCHHQGAHIGRHRPG